MESLTITHSAPNTGCKASGRVTVSAGVAAMVPTRDQAAKRLIQAADNALYASKKAGRNRVSRAP
ncbi:MAG: GGDEF domain-containing protein [Candidatus Thiosymbion ectosymbiont of Robbea hypermnestra]|nr:GGDEF domain-containing protein [Candidatus Thiosymbion ectosymbiont of Robbea hypermnestra]